MKRALSHKEHLDRLASAVSLENVTVAYGSRIVLHDISIDVPVGEITAVVGPNNCGKTTLIKTILGIVKPVAGNVYIFARPGKGLKNDIALVPNHADVNWSFPTNVFDLVLMGAYNRLKLQERPDATDKEMAAETLERFKLYEIRKKCITELTIGERQRALAARAVLQNPRIYLTDEPILASDRQSSDIIIQVFDELKRLGKTILSAHHDILSVPSYFDRVVFLNVKTVCAGPYCDVFNEENIKNTFGVSESLIKKVSGTDKK